MNILKLGIAFTFGAVAGVIGGKLYFEKKAEDRADSEIDEVKKYYLEKSIKEREEIKNIGVDLADCANKGLISDSGTKEEKKDDNNTYEKAKVDYAAKSKPEKGKKKMETMVETEHPEEDPPNEPYEISQDEFIEDKREYDKITLSWYDEDEVLVDDSGEIADISNTVGSDLLDKFVTDEYDNMFVRNDNMSADYEIDLVYGSYKDSTSFNVPV